MPKRVSFVNDLPYGSEAYLKADEWHHQVALFEAFRKEFPELRADYFAIPNGGYRDPREAVNLVMEGATKGVSDTLLSMSCWGYHGLFLEMKKPLDPVIKENQIAFIERKRLTGYAGFVGRGWMQGLDILRWYLGTATGKEILLNSGVDLVAQMQGDYGMRVVKK